MDGAAILERIEARRAAKAARDFASADRIRAELATEGIELIDRPGDVTDWVRS
jgi:cysteinyl-tRNA synthetase